MSRTPVVSVVVATHRRVELLAQLLECLERQRLDGELEVVIVDDGSGEEAWEHLARMARLARVPVRPLRLARQSGPAAARNLGWRAARADLLAFTDDDCLPQPGWLAALVRRLGQADMVQGRTVPVPDKEAGRGPFARSIWVEQPDGRFETANMGYRRAVLEAVGGFDERFRRPFGEDIDLAWRAREAGAVPAFEPEALVYHEVFPSSWPAYVRETRRRSAIVAVVARHPGFRRHLHSRWCYEAGHPQAAMAAAGVAAAGVAAFSAAAGRPCGAGPWVAASVLAAPYGWFRMVRHPLPCRPRNRLPMAAMALVADLAEIAVLATASARYRTLVL